MSRSDSERRTFWATAQVEIEDVTAEEAQWIVERLDSHTIEIDGYEVALRKLLLSRDSGSAESE